MINNDPHKNKTEITHFFNKMKLIRLNIIPKINLNIMHKIFFHQMMKNTNTKIINDFYSNQRPHSCSIEQPDIFEPYTRNDQIRQSRNNPTPHNNSFQQRRNPANTQSN